MPPQSILIVGDHDYRDFEPAVAWLRRHARVTCCREAPEASRHAASAELIVFAQSRPGRFRQSDVESLYRQAPLARLAVLLGAWCEGEMRTDAPLNGVVRIYWHEWEAKLAPLWDSAREPAAWNLPRTSVPGERTLAASSMPEATTRELIAVRALSVSSYASLADALRTADFASVWLDPRQPFRTRPAALLWEGDVRVAHQCDELSRLAAAVRPAPTIVLASFLRPEDRRLALAAGAADVVGKPFLVSELMLRLRAALIQVERYSPNTAASKPVSVTRDI